ncbi:MULTISPECIES: saccharopine dehydrogenase NADP-binding domain-containing protein [unclassified Embleya]|uniref:saccharopine dehydrogenase family protein n=1 Tax=unclassified Embleya TaxID=2699296 RepID=UPI0033FAAC1A
MKIVILSSGAVASRVAKRAVAFPGVDDLVVADLDAERAQALADRIGARAAQFDATDPDSVTAVVSGADVVFNGVGPFYRFALPIVDATIRAGANYIDICDEYDVAEALVTDPRYDERAKAAGVTVLTGCGVAPGTTNLMARWACDGLDRADAVHVVMGLPFVANLGPTILEHMFHSLSGDVTQYLDGEYRKVPAWSNPRQFQLLAPYGPRDFGYFGHAEPITLPRFIPGLKEATSGFTWWQQAGNDIYKTLGDLGLMSAERGELPMSPQAYIARYFSSTEGEQAVQTDVSDAPIGAVFHIRAEGEKDGAPASVSIETHSDMSDPDNDDSAADITAIPAAAFLRRLVAGEIDRTGVLAPEGCVDPEPFLREVLPQLGITMYRTENRTERVL